MQSRMALNLNAFLNAIKQMEYSKHPRIRTNISASQSKLVLIFWVFSKKSGCLSS